MGCFSCSIGVFFMQYSKSCIRVVLTVYLINTSINTPGGGCYHCIWLVNIVVLYIFCIHHGICAPLSVFVQYITKYMHRYKSDTDAKPVKFNTLPRHEAMHTTIQPPDTHTWRHLQYKSQYQSTYKVSNTSTNTGMDTNKIHIGKISTQYITNTKSNTASEYNTRYTRHDTINAKLYRFQYVVRIQCQYVRTNTFLNT